MTATRVLEWIQRRAGGSRPRRLDPRCPDARPPAPDWREVQRLYDQRELESTVLLQAAERYANDVEGLTAVDRLLRDDSSPP